MDRCGTWEDFSAAGYADWGYTKADYNSQYNPFATECERDYWRCQSYEEYIAAHGGNSWVPTECEWTVDSYYNPNKASTPLQVAACYGEMGSNFANQVCDKLSLGSSFLNKLSDNATSCPMKTVTLDCSFLEEASFKTCATSYGCSEDFAHLMFSIVKPNATQW